MRGSRGEQRGQEGAKGGREDRKEARNRPNKPGISRYCGGPKKGCGCGDPRPRLDLKGKKPLPGIREVLSRGRKK